MQQNQREPELTREQLEAAGFITVDRPTTINMIDQTKRFQGATNEEIIAGIKALGWTTVQSIDTITMADSSQTVTLVQGF